MKSPIQKYITGFRESLLAKRMRKRKKERKEKENKTRNEIKIKQEEK